MATLAPSPKFQPLDANGAIVPGGKLYTYHAGTTTPVATYTDSTGLTLNTNPVILDASGRASVWLGSGSYKFVLKSSLEVELWAVDYINTPSEITMYALKANLSAIPLASIASGSSAIVISRTVAGDNGGGLFRWDASNLSTQVTNDTQQGVYIPPDNASTGASGAWVRVFTGDLRPEWWGVRANGTNDDTTALQAAIDYANYVSDGVSDGGMRTLRLPSGVILISSTILWKSVDLIGDSEPNAGTMIKWGGAVGGTMVQKWSTSHQGTGSFFRMANVLFAKGANAPAICLDLSTWFIDKFGLLERIQFTGSTECGVKMAGWVNCHWRDLRWDECGDYAIKMTTDSTQSSESFVLDRFTYDNGTSGGLGFLYIDNPANFAGTMRLSNARIELNSTWTGSSKALIHHKVGSTTQSMLFDLVDINLFAVGAATGLSVIRREGGATGLESYHIRNLDLSSTQWTVVTGDYNAGYQVIPTIPANGKIHFVSTAGLNAGSFSAIPGPTQVSDNGSILSCRAVGEANDRFNITGQGDMRWGAGGASATDCTVERHAAGRLKTDSDWILNVAGNGLYVKEGSNATSGVATLAAGTVTVSTTKVTSNSRVHLTGNSDGGTPGWKRVSARVAGTSFTITSSDAADTGTVAWLIVEPA